MPEAGFAVEVNVDAQGSELDQAALSTDTILFVGDASAYDPAATVEVNDARAVVASVDVNAGTVTLATPLGVAADVGDRVYVVSGGAIAYDYSLDVHLSNGESVDVPIAFVDRTVWPIGPVDPPIPVVVSDDLTRLLDAPGRSPLIGPDFVTLSVDTLLANNALIDALGVVDLSATTLAAVNIDGGSISIATSSAGGETVPFSGTSLPAGWTSVKTNFAGGAGGAASIPGASVVNSGAPAGVSGSALLVDYGPSGSTTDEAAGKIVTNETAAADALVEVRFRHAVTADITQRLRIGIRRQGLANDFSTEDAIFLELGYLLGRMVSTVNGSDSVLGTAPVATDPASAWHIAKLRVVSGQVQAKVWQDGATEPAYTTFQQSGVLTPGEVAITWRQFLLGGSVPSIGQKSWIDYVNVTTYSTGFSVNPDGTGDWPALTAPLIARLDDLEARVAALEGP